MLCYVTYEWFVTYVWLVVTYFITIRTIVYERNSAEILQDDGSPNHIVWMRDIAGDETIIKSDEIWFISEGLHQEKTNQERRSWGSSFTFSYHVRKFMQTCAAVKDGAERFPKSALECGSCGGCCGVQHAEVGCAWGIILEVDNLISASAFKEERHFWRVSSTSGISVTHRKRCIYSLLVMSFYYFLMLS